MIEYVFYATAQPNNDTTMPFIVVHLIFSAFSSIIIFGVHCSTGLAPEGGRCSVDSLSTESQINTRGKGQHF